MTDKQLLRAAIKKAGSLTALARVPQMPHAASLWRWKAAGRISTDRQRAILAQYLESGSGESA